MALSYPYARDDEILQAFHTWRRSTKAQLTGLGGPDCNKTCMFIPKSRIEDYFKRPHQLDKLLDKVLDPSVRPAVDANYVRGNYLRSFAILLCIGKGHLIHHFQQHQSLQDDKLPYGTRPDEFPFTTPDEFQEFKNAQWQFCAPTLNYTMNSCFKEEDILPIISKDKIGEGGSAIIYKIVVDENYNSLLPQNQRRQHTNTFVLKTFRAAEAEQCFKDERDAFQTLKWGGNPSAHIISYYGAFVHGNSHNIILEYANEGTLESFMKKTPSPSSVEDTLLLWDRLLDVTHGIMTIHGKIGNESSASPRLRGLHQDIKPTNILVLRGNGASPYDCHFKIADLGLTFFKPISQNNVPSDLDAFGTRAYGAPETFRSHVDTESVPLQVTPAVDIWSIGCVFSEVSVWAYYGWDTVVDYRRQRSKEVKDKGGGEGEYIFHFEGDRLSAVENIHQRILKARFASNHITRSILKLVDDMLQKGDRPHAKLVHEKSKRLVKDCKQRFEIGLVDNSDGQPIDSKEDWQNNSSQPLKVRNHSPRAERALLRVETLSPDDNLAPSASFSRSYSSDSTHHHLSTTQGNTRRSVGATQTPQPGGENTHSIPCPPPAPSTTAGQQHQEELVRPTLSINEGLRWKQSHKIDSDIILPGGENLTALDQRNHIFLIDNSASMEQYREDIEKVVELLAYVLKSSDKDGLDIHFTQNSQQINSQKSSKLSSSIKSMRFGGVPDMRGRLSTILQEHRSRFGTDVSPRRRFFVRSTPSQPQPQRPLSFYVLTDAKWQPNNDVGGLIKDLVTNMRDKGCRKEHVAIQFIRFGNHPAGIEKLDKLDHGLGLSAMSMDIVDHTYWDGNVWKQLLGALNNWYDDDPP